MRFRNYWREACLLAALAAVVAGCSREGKGNGNGESVVLTDPAAVSSPEAAPAESAFNIMIAPDSPAVRDALRVVSLDGVPIETYRWAVNGEVIEGENGANLTPGFARKGDSVSVIATSRGRDVGAEVRVRNTPPEIEELPFSPADFFRGVDITVTPHAEDPDGDLVSFSYLWLINDEEITWEYGPTLSGDRFRRGDRLALQVTPFDGEEHGKMFRSRAVVVPNARPDIVSTPPVNFESRVYRYQVKAEDVDGDALAFVLVNAPAGMVIGKETGEIVWQIGEDQTGEHRVRIEVQDEAGAKAFQEYSITISLPMQVIN
jgi:hypothetical protein